MKLGEKVRYLREVEGNMRGLKRAMTQQELVRAVKMEMKYAISQSYISQIENGSRRHLTDTTRTLLANFFKVHPGYLVDDPDLAKLPEDMKKARERLELWLINGAEWLARDPEVGDALLKVARHEDSRNAVVLLGRILNTPGLMNRMMDAMKPADSTANVLQDS